MSDKPSPLAGLKVVELARILAGPWMGQVLADLGADVIKIESPAGDDTRQWGPPFVERGSGDGRDAAYFHSCNRGKRSVTADLGKSRDLDMVLALIRRADVLVENFKLGGLRRFGLDYPSVHAINPKLVYCSITGFGQDGPYAQRPGYDAIIQAMSGIMSMTGEADGAPQKMGVAFADIFAGLYGVIAIQAALAQRQRSGKGQHVDISLLDCMVGVLANQNLNYLVSGQAPGRLGSAHPNIVPYQVFAVADGRIMLAVGNDAQFARLCKLLSLPELAHDPRYETNAARVQHREQLVPALAATFASWSRADILLKLQEHGIPAGPLNTLDQVFKDPQVRHRKLQIGMPQSDSTQPPIPGVRTPIIFSDASLQLTRPSPALGQHNAEIRQEIAATQADGDNE